MTITIYTFIGGFIWGLMFIGGYFLPIKNTRLIGIGFILTGMILSSLTSVLQQIQG